MTDHEGRHLSNERPPREANPQVIRTAGVSTKMLTDGVKMMSDRVPDQDI